MKAVAVLKHVVCEQLRQQRLQEMLELLRMTEQQQVLDDEEWDEVVSTALLLPAFSCKWEPVLSQGSGESGLLFLQSQLAVWCTVILSVQTTVVGKGWVCCSASCLIFVYSVLKCNILSTGVCRLYFMIH